ncbi:MAG: urease accessory protein UreE [Rhizobiaceae bacterium]
MKLNLNTDFTSLPRAGTVAPAGQPASIEPFGFATLEHDERHLRRRVLTLDSGDKILVDLVEATALDHGDRLVLDDGRQVEIRAAEEALLAIEARTPVELGELCWHIGNRHLAAQIEERRILVLRDHVIKAMLEGLGATVTEITAPFVPVRGAYSGHGHDHGHHHHDHDHHDHDHDHGHDPHHHGHHDHGHGERDSFGRLPGDPHYGHNHP